ncbi:MAG: hypothetical protein ACJ8BW_06425 [Ktedonobacteraceae bacterium]|jgi:hypothetical protein
MTTFDPDQALAAYIELHDKQAQEVDRRPDLLRRMERGDYDFMVDADYSIRELEREAERNGYSLSVDLDFCEMKKDSICRKMTPEEWEQYLEWEKEE